LLLLLFIGGGWGGRGAEQRPGVADGELSSDRVWRTERSDPSTPRE